LKANYYIFSIYISSENVMRQTFMTQHDITVTIILKQHASKTTTAFTTVFVDTWLWKTKHLRKHFQNFCQSCVLSTDRIKIHQSQPLVWPSDLLYVILAGCDWWISHTSLTETFPQLFCFPKLRINKNGGNNFMEPWYHDNIIPLGTGKVSSL